jgi:hypothetical protein
MRAGAISVLEGGKLGAAPANGIHLLWGPPGRAGYALKGFDIERRRAHDQAKVTCYALTAAEIDQLHRLLRVETAAGSVALRSAARPEPPAMARDTPFAAAAKATKGGKATKVTKRAAHGALVAGSWWAYTIDLHRRASAIRITTNAGPYFAYAFADGGAVAVESTTGTQVSFGTRAADQVVLYAEHPFSALEICRTTDDDDDGDWKVLVRELQLPLAKADPTLAPGAD